MNKQEARKLLSAKVDLVVNKEDSAISKEVDKIRRRKARSRSKSKEKYKGIESPEQQGPPEQVHDRNTKHT